MATPYGIKKRNMSQSLSKLYVHIVFHVKNTIILIRGEDKKELFAYMGSIVKDNGRKSFTMKVSGIFGKLT